MLDIDDVGGNSQAAGMYARYIICRGARQAADIYTKYRRYRGRGARRAKGIYARVNLDELKVCMLDLEDIRGG